MFNPKFRENCDFPLFVQPIPMSTRYLLHSRVIVLNRKFGHLVLKVEVKGAKVYILVISVF